MESKQKRQLNEELGYEDIFVDGNNDKQMITIIDYKGKKLVFAADLLPTAGHIPLPYVMGFDTRPLKTLQEKKIFLEEATQNNYHLFLEHDAHNEIINLKDTEKGIRLDSTFSFNELFTN